MLSKTLIVNVDPDVASTFDDFFSRLIGVENSTFASECKSLIESDQIESLVTKYLDNIDSIFKLDDDKGTSDFAFLNFLLFCSRFKISRAVCWLSYRLSQCTEKDPF